MNNKIQTIFGLLFLWVLSLGAYADFKPALTRLALDRDRVQPGGTLHATYTFRSSGPAPVDLEVFVHVVRPDATSALISPLTCRPPSGQRKGLCVKDRSRFWIKEEFTADLTVGQGRPNLAAIRPGGNGDITESHVKWNLRTGIPEISSPVFHAGRLYLVRDGGVLSCVNAASGEVIYRERLGATGQYSASPVIANDHVYLVSAKGMLTVVKCGDKFEIVHQTDLKAAVAATPAMDQNRLYVRTDEAMLAFR
jgi:outer membrane protein assembly factor BamB